MLLAACPGKRMQASPACMATERMGMSPPPPELELQAERLLHNQRASQAQHSGVNLLQAIWDFQQQHGHTAACCGSTSKTD